MTAAITIVQICLLGAVAAGGTVLNIVTILAFTLFKPSESGLDTTTVTLVIQLCLYDLFTSAVCGPMRIWNVVVGLSTHNNSNGDGSSVFYDNSLACWALSANLPTIYAVAWTLLCLAFTRLLATLAPHQYEKWLRTGWARWSFNLVPVLFSYGLHACFSLAGIFKVSVDAQFGGMCVLMPVARTPQALHRNAVIANFNFFFGLLFPLATGALLYAIIFVKLKWASSGRLRFNMKLIKPVLTGQQQQANSNQSAPTAGVVAANTTSNTIAAQYTAAQPLPTQPPPTLPPSSLHGRPQRSELVVVQSKKRQLRSAKVLALSYVLYTGCLLPLTLLITLVLGVPTPATVWIATLLECLQFCSSYVSPIVYVLTLRDMRVALKKLVKCAKKQ